MDPSARMNAETKVKTEGGSFIGTLGSMWLRGIL